MDSLLKTQTFRSAVLLAALLLTGGLFTGCDRVDPLYPEERLKLLLEEASRAVTVFNYNEAYRLYGQAREIAEVESEDWIVATFGLATSGWHRLPPNRGSISESRSLFEELVEVLPKDSIFRIRSQLNLGRLHELRNFPGDSVNPEIARVYYRTVMEEQAGTIFADEAAGRLASSFLREFERPEVVRASLVELETYLRGRQDSPIANVLYYFLGTKYWTYLRDPERSFDSFERAIERGLVEQARIWQVYWRMAEMAENHLNRPLDAAAYYRRIVVETPRSARIFEARQAYERLQALHPDELPDLPPPAIP